MEPDAPNHDLAARKKTERELAEKARLLDLTHDAIIVRDLHNRISVWNKGAQRMFGWSAEEVMGRDLHSLLKTEFPKPLEEILVELQRAGHFLAEVVQTARDGRRFSTLCRWVLDPETKSILTSYTDISAVRPAERKMRATIEQHARKARVFHTTLSAIPELAYTLDRNGRFLYANEPLLKLWGLSLEEAVGKNYFDLHYEPRLAAKLQREVQQVVETGVELSDETDYVNPAGKKGCYEYVFSPVVGATGLVEMIAGYARDITERKAIEQALRESERRFRELANNSPVMIWVTDPSGHCSFLSESWYRYTGQSEEEGLGIGWVNAVHPDDHQLTHDAFVSANAHRRSFRVEYRLRSRTGEYRWAIDAAMPRLGEDGEFLGYVGSVLDIHDQRMAQEALRASEARFRAAVGAVSSLIWTNNAKGEMEGEQPGWSGFTGQSREEYQGYGWAKAVHPDDAQPTIDGWNQAVAEKRMFEFEHRVRRRDGAWRLCSIRAVPVVDDSGQVREWVGVHTDITESRQTLQALRDAQAQVHAALLGGAVGTWNWDLRTNMLTANPSLLKIFGLNSANGGLSPEVFINTIVPEDQPAVRDQIASALAPDSDGVYQVEYRVRDAVGNIRWVFARGQVEYDAARKPICLPGALTDITDRKEGERVVAALAAIVNFSDDAIIGKNLDHIITSWNKGAERLYGYTASEAIGQSVTMLIPPERQHEEPVILARIRRGELVENFETLRVRKDGSVLVVSLTISPIKDGQGRVVGASKIARDITGQKKAEEALRESEERFRQMADNIPPLAWMADEKGWIFWYNRRWHEYTGTTHEEMQGWGWEKVHEPGELQRMLPGWKHALATGEPWEDIFPLRRADGQYGWFLSRAFPIRDAEGNITRWFGTNIDITELRETQAQLGRANALLSNRAQQLEQLVEKRTADLRETVQQLETFSYSIVHDMRAPLRSMRSFAEFLDLEYRDKLDLQGRDYVQRIMSSAVRMDALITDVLTYSQVSSAEMPLSDLDVNRLVTDIVQGYPQFQEKAECIRIERPLPAVRGNPALLTQIISNLLGNALKFVSPDRTPRVTVRGARENGKARLWVEDNGIGIAPEHYDKIFGLFQRLHRPDQYAGTGVGLAIVHRSAERMGAKVGFESEAGKGSRFWVELDAAREPAL